MNLNENEFIFEKFELELERVHILRDELERELERQKNENVQYSGPALLANLQIGTYPLLRSVEKG